MAFIENGQPSRGPVTLLNLAPKLDSALVSLTPRLATYSASAITGTIAAALAAGRIFFMRVGANAYEGNKEYCVYITKLSVVWTTIAAFTTPFTVNRRLTIARGSSTGNATNQTIVNAAKRHSSTPDSIMSAALGGDIRIAGTSAIAITGATYDANVMATMLVSDVGNAGNTKSFVFEFDRLYGGPVVLRPSELFIINNPATMDAGGTWQLAVNVEWAEGVL